MEEWYQNESPEPVEDVAYTVTTTYYAYVYTDGNTYVRVPYAYAYDSNSKFKVGDTVTTGSVYWFKVEPIKWIVLNPTTYESDGYLELVSWDILAGRISTAVLWENSGIRSWLNSSFYSEAFTDTEQGAINLKTVENNSSSSDYATDGSGTSTEDYLYLLSYYEVHTAYKSVLYSTTTHRRATSSDFGAAHYVGLQNSYKTLEGYDAGSWYLRTTYGSNNWVYAVYGDSCGNTSVSYSSYGYGIRPAMQLSDTSVEINYNSTTGWYYIEYGSYPQSYVDSWAEDVSYSGQGLGTSSDPYIVTSAEQLAYFAYYTQGIGAISSSTYIQLGADIDLSGKYWKPIGSSSCTFSGNFNGNGYTITGLTIDASSSYQGLFGYCGSGSNIYNLNIDSASVTNTVSYTGILAGYMYSSSKLSNIEVTNSSITASSYTGGVAGYFYSGTVSNVAVEVTISASSSTGGLFGYAYGSSTISSCTFSGSMTGGSNCGGLVGYVYKNTIITNCIVEGDVTSTGSECGGVVGYVYIYVTISNVVVSGSIYCKGYYAGGLVGDCGASTWSHSYSTIITSCIFRGCVTNTSSSGRAGGLVGICGSSHFTLKKCYAECDISCSGGYCGGLVGQRTNNSSDNVTITNCYYMGNITYDGSTTYCNGICGYWGGTASLADCFAICSITSTVLDSSSSLGITTSTNSYVTYNNCYIIENITWTDTSENHMYILDNTGTDPTFEDFFYESLINNAYPMITSLSAIGQFYSGQDVYSYLIGLGFVVV